MAVYAAHLTRTLQGSPSIFEVTAQESLATTVKPALRKVVEFLASINPAKFNWLVRWYDEAYLLFSSVLQYHYIKHYAASFAENFYGLQRIPLKTSEFTDGYHLPAHQEKLSFFFLVLFPYIRQKLDSLIDKYRIDEEDGLLDRKDWTCVIKKCFIRSYAALHFAFEGACLAQYLAYMAGRASSYSPLLAVAGLTLRYTPEIVPDDQNTWAEMWGNVVSRRYNSLRISAHMVGTAVLSGMEVGAFCIQFLRWWDSKGPSRSIEALPVPEPPSLDSKSHQYKNHCPICLQDWKIPTVLPVSGYVFCYKCITRHMKNSSTCPVTKYPCRQQDLIRMYID